MVTAHYLDISVELKGGKLRVVKLAKGEFSAGPVTIRRFRGRFEVRLHAHGLLLDVVRFDLPLTAAAEDQTSPGKSTSLGDRLGLGLAKGVTGRTVVRVPFDDRFTRAAIHDTVSRKVVKVDLTVVLPPPPKTRPATDLRVRSFGKGLEDTAVLKGARGGKKPEKHKQRQKKSGKQP